MTVFSASIESAVVNRRELAQALLTWVGAARNDRGIVRARLLEDLESPGGYVLASTWDNRQDLEAHFEGADFGILLGALEVLATRTDLSVTHTAAGEEDPVALVRRLRGHVPPLGRPQHAPDTGMPGALRPGGMA